MRLFFAVAADKETRAAAAAAVARLRVAAGESYRWVDPRDMHVTLRYLGEATPEDQRAAEQRLREAAARHAPFELEYAGVGAFDSLADARVVWLGLARGGEPLARLAQELGYDEPRPYAPHLTLGRRRRMPLPAFAAALRAEPVLRLARSVGTISLWASRPASFGHAYEIVAEAPLNG
jgi:2'-5' RNA ligase